MTRLDAETDGGTVAVTLTAQDLDDIDIALGVYTSDYEGVDSDADINRARALAAHLRTVRAALP